MIAEGSIAGVMEGCKYNCAVRPHNVVHKALIRLAWKGFISWLEAKGETWSDWTKY